VGVACIEAAVTDCEGHSEEQLSQGREGDWLTDCLSNRFLYVYDGAGVAVRISFLFSYY